MWSLVGVFVFAVGSVLVGFGVARPHAVAGALGLTLVTLGLAGMAVPYFS